MTDFNAWLDGGVTDEKKKKFDITPSTYKQNTTGTDFNAFLASTPEPKKATPSITPTPAVQAKPQKQGFDLGATLNSLTNTIKNALVNAIPQLKSKVEVPQTPQTPTPDITTLLDKTKNLPKTPIPQLGIDTTQPDNSAQLSDTVRNSPEFIASQQKTQNIIDSVLRFNPIDTAITKTQDFLAKQAEDYTSGGQKGMPPLVYSLAFYQKVTEPLLENKYTRAVVRSESKAILGSSQKIQDLFNTKLDKPQTVGDQVAYTGIDMLTGLANLVVGGNMLKALGVAKTSVLPTLFVTLGQLGSPPSTTVQQRLAKAPLDMLTGWLFNLVPGSDKLFSLKTLQGMGYVGAITAPTAFVSYLVEGLPAKEAAIEALKATAINAAFHGIMVAKARGEAKLFGEMKFDNTVFTPDQTRTQAEGTNLKGTPAGDYLSKAATEAEIQGKNIKIEVVAQKQGKLVKPFGAETTTKIGEKLGVPVVTSPDGVGFRATLVDAPAPVQQLTGEKPQPKTAITTTKPVVEPQTGIEIPPISPATPEVNKLNIKGLDKITETKIEELNTQDIKNPAPDGKIRVYQSVAPNMSTDYVFKSPQELASYKNNVTAPEEQFRYIDVNPNQLKAVEGKQGVFQITDIEKNISQPTKSDFPKAITDFWQDKTSTAFTQERLDQAGITKKEVVALIDKAINSGVDKQFILDRSKYTATKLAIEDIKTEIEKVQKPVEIKTQEFNVGDVLDPQGNTNMSGKVTIRETSGNTLKFTDEKGIEFAGMAKSTVRNLIKGGSWKKVTSQKETQPTYQRGDITKLETELDQLLGTESFNFNGSWKNKLQARNTAFSQLEYYAGEGDTGAKEVLNKVNEIENKLATVRQIKQQGGFADIGGYSDVQSMEKTLKGIKAIEFPEMLRIAKELMGGKVPSVALPRFRPTLGGRPLGLFTPTGEGKITLNPDIFKEPTLAARVLAHEMGHLTDYLPEGTMGRGNLVGRIGSLNKFMRELFSDPDTEKVINKLISERTNYQEQRRKLKNEKGIVTDKKADKTILTEIKRINKQIKELQKNAIKNTVVREELIKLTQLWKPFDDKMDEAFTDYRYSPPELYADAISVLYNDPDLLKKTAPTFYENFFENIDRKPTISEAFFEIQKLLNRGEAAVSEERDKEINEMFKKGEDLYRVKREEYKKKQTDLLFRLKYDFIDKNQKMIDYVNKAKKAGKVIPDEDNPQYWLEEYNYLGGVLKNFAEIKIQPIYETLGNNDIEWSNFGKYLFLDRVINERGEFANPLGYAPDTAKTQIEYLKSQIGEDKFNTLVEQANLFRDNIKSLLDPATEAGIYNPEVVKDLKLNPAYATFQVLDYLDDYIPASIKKQVGTLKEIANPADAMILKTMSLLRAIEKNKTKTKMIEFIKENEPKEIQEARTRFNGKYHEPVEPKDLGKGLFTVMESGKIKGYYVDEYVAKIFEYAGTGNTNAFLRFMGMLNSKYFRPVFTTFNTGFQSFNIFRDFFRYWKNQPSLNIIDVLNQYRKALPHAYNRAFGKYDEIVSQMEKSKILSVTMSDLLGGEGAEVEEKQIEFALRKAGLSPMNDTRKGLLKPIFQLLDTIENIGSLVESLPKISAYLRYQGEMKPKELGHFIRTMAGSPDFLRKGAGYYGYNNIFLFSNAIKEGFRADFEASVKNPKTRTGWWLKTFMANILPKLFMFAAGLGTFGIGIKRMIDKTTEYDKTNYIVIPLGENENGQVTYMRIPQDETGRFVSGLFWKMLNIGNEDQSVMKNVSDIFSFMGGQAPNLNPLITVGSAVFQFGIGQNPYDWQKGKNVIPDTNFKAGGKYALIPFIKWISDSLGGGIIYRFNVTQKAPESQTWTEKIINSPILSNVLGRWIRVTDYGVKESLTKQQTKIEADQAARTIEKKAMIKKYATEYKKNPSQGLLNVENQLVRDAFQLKGQPTTAQKQGITILRKQFRVAVATGQNTYIDSFFYATSNDEKLAILKEMKSNTEYNKFKGALKALKDQGLISSDLIIRALKQ